MWAYSFFSSSNLDGWDIWTKLVLHKSIVQFAKVLNSYKVFLLNFQILKLC